MKTTVNVMGIQATSILERIAATLEAVLRVGKENRSVQVIGGKNNQARGSRLEVFTAQDPVFPEERVVSEIPQTLWMSVVLADPKGLSEKREAGRTKYVTTPYKKVNPSTAVKKRTAKRAKHLTLVRRAQAEAAPAREIRDLSSSLSPPRQSRM